MAAALGSGQTPPRMTRVLWQLGGCGRPAGLVDVAQARGLPPQVFPNPSSSTPCQCLCRCLPAPKNASASPCKFVCGSTADSAGPAMAPPVAVSRGGQRDVASASYKAGLLAYMLHHLATNQLGVQIPLEKTRCSGSWLSATSRCSDH